MTRWLDRLRGKNRQERNETPMFVIAGLGNPGKKYENTRHNMGFMAIDSLAEKYDIRVNKLKHRALIGDGTIVGQRVMLVKPQTYMNLSGESLREIVSYYNIELENLIVIYDDFDIDIGTLRLRKKGSAGSHNGMKSIVQQLGSQEFPRIRIGIGSSGSREWKDFVLGRVGSQENDKITQAVERAADAAACIVEKGIDKAMNEYNVRAEDMREDKIDSKRND